MTGFIICMTPLNGTPEYWPEGFGFSVHKHATRCEDAKVFTSESEAWHRANNYRWPPAFWESERRHRDLMEKKFRGWKFEVLPSV